MELTKTSSSQSHQQFSDNMSALYEASYKGSVSTLNSLIHKDPSILSKISRTKYTETPLHISASLGHLAFTKALLTHNPKLALELDFSKCTPLHVASSEGHVDIVKELLKVEKQACLFPDENGRIPLHYATMRGRTEVVTELIKGKPNSLSFHDNEKIGVFHLCVAYNQLQILKTLVNAEEELHNFMHDWNDILKLAIMFKQVEIIRYLLSIPKVIEAARSEKEMGLISWNMLECGLKDSKILEIQLMLINSGAIKSRQITKTDDDDPPTTTSSSSETIHERKSWVNIMKWMVDKLQYKGDFLEEMRGNLILVSTMISAMTFQAVMNPPGSFVQQGINQSSKEPFDCVDSPNGYPACPGDALSAIKFPAYFHPYIKYSTFCFIASLSVTLLLVSGIPLKRKPVMWVLSIGMCLTLTFLALAYLFGLMMVTPDGALFESAYRMARTSIYVWIVLLGLVAVFITLRFLIWLVKKKCINIYKRFKSRRRPRNQNQQTSV